MTKVLSVAHLREMVQKGEHDFFIALNGGLRSSKQIDCDDENFYIFNEIDGTEDQLSEADLMDRNITNVGYAITKGALYCYE